MFTMDNLVRLATLGFFASIWGLIILGIAGGMLKACCKHAKRMWKKLDRYLKESAVEAQEAVDVPQAQLQPRDTRPLPEVPPNWQKDPKLAFCKLAPTPTPPTPQTSSFSPSEVTSITLPPIPF